MPDTDAVTRAYLAAAAGAIGKPASQRSEAHASRGQTGHTNGVELRDEAGTPICQLRAATEIERAGRRVSSIDPNGIQALLAQIPQAAFSSLLLQQMSGHVVLSWAPEVAAQLAQHAARVMRSADVFRAQAVDVITGTVIGQASFTPVSVTTLGIAAGWQLLSLVVAQKHLSDINARLDQIERKVGELRDLLDADLLAEMRGDAEHLLGIVRAFAASCAELSAARLEHRPIVEAIIRSTRSRREKVAERVRRVGETFTPYRGARYFGRTLGKAADELLEDVEKFVRNVVAQRLNTLVISAAIELSRQLDKDVAYTKQLEADVARWISDDDNRFSEFLGPLENAIMSVDGTFVRRKTTAAAARARIASRVWIGSRAASALRGELGRVHPAIEVAPPQLLLSVSEGRSIDAVSWINTEVA